MIKEIRFNILILGAIGALMVAYLGYQFPQNGDLVFGLAGVLLGSFATVMKDILADDPPPSVPAYIVEKLMAKLDSSSPS